MLGDRQAGCSESRHAPYQWSRNPVYLLNSLWLLGTLAAAHGLMTWAVIPREERYLERKFGAEYLKYKANVRRWF